MGSLSGTAIRQLRLGAENEEPLSNKRESHVAYLPQNNGWAKGLGSAVAQAKYHDRPIKRRMKG